MQRLLTVAVLLGFLLSACHSNSEIIDIPAVIVEMNDKSRLAISRAVSQALNRSSVLIANDVFTTSNLLLIERRPQQTIQGRLAVGRENRLPDQFRLLLRGDKCLLLHVQKNEVWPLKDVICQSEDRF